MAVRSEIIQGDALECLKMLQDASVDCVVTSPPYWGLRAYGTNVKVWDGDPACEHEWGIKAEPRRSRSENDIKNPDSKEASKPASSFNAPVTEFCSKCGAWRGELGLEPNFDLYIQHLCQIFDEVKRVLKPTGTCWINIGDTYASNNKGTGGEGAGYKQRSVRGSHFGSLKVDAQLEDKCLSLVPVRFALKMIDRGWILRNVIIWHKPNCLAANTPVYVMSRGKSWRTSIREMARVPLETLYIMGKDGWRKVISMERKPAQDLLTIHLRNGMKIEATPEHLFPVGKELLRADQLKQGMLLEHVRFPDVHGSALGSYANGWIVGLYIAEGSRCGKSIQFSLHKNELTLSKRIAAFAKKYAGDFREHVYGNNRVAIISGDVVVGIISNYVDGYGVRGKHLSRKAFCENNRFLQGVLDGYLSGDGHYDAQNDRWMLGQVRNRELEYDLRTVCNRLGYFARLFLRKMKCRGKVHSIIRGEIRKRRSGHFNQKDDFEILRINKTKGITYEIEVDGDHLFALADGTLTHNCMPSSVKDRFTVDFEYVFFFVKNKTYYFEQQFEPYTEALNRWGGPKFAKGAPSKFDGVIQNYNRGGRDVRPSPLGKNKRCVWSINTHPLKEEHYAAYPEKLVEPMIKAGCPEEICSVCGRAKEKIFETNNPSKGFTEFVGYRTCECRAEFKAGIVLDPFCGSGTTGIAAKKLHRDFIGIELVPKYAEMARRRIERTKVPVRRWF